MNRLYFARSNFGKWRGARTLGRAGQQIKIGKCCLTVRICNLDFFRLSPAPPKTPPRRGLPEPIIPSACVITRLFT